MAATRTIVPSCIALLCAIQAARADESGSSAATIAKTLRDRGAMVRLDEQGMPVALDALKAKLTDDDLESLATLKDLRAVKLSQQAITDSGLKKLAQLPKLKSLGL